MKALIIIVILTLSGCTTTRVQRGSLSEAMDKAKEPDREDRQVEDSRRIREPDPWEDDDPWDDDDTRIFSWWDLFDDEEPEPFEPEAEEDQPGSALKEDPNYKEMEFGNIYGVEAEYRLSPTQDFMHTAALNYIIGGTGTYGSILTKTGLLYTPVASEGNFSESIYGINGFNMGLEIKNGSWQLAEITWISLFFESAFTYSFWVYKNSIYSNVYDSDYNLIGTDTISWDGIWNLSASIGPSVMVKTNDTIGLTIEPALAMNFYAPYTTQAFTNDVLYTQPYFKVMCKVLFFK